MVKIDDESLTWLAAHAMNSMAYVTSEGLQKCCPHSCAPCAALWRLHFTGALDEILKSYGPGYDWWDDEQNKVKWEWVEERWCKPVDCDWVHDTADDRGHGTGWVQDDWEEEQKAAAGRG